MEGKNKSTKCKVPIEKIAYYVQELFKKESDVGKIILVVKSQFCDNDIKEFAEKYYKCPNENNVRHLANLLYSVPTENISKYLQNTTY